MNTLTIGPAKRTAANGAGNLLEAERPEEAQAGKRMTYDGRFYGPFLLDGEPKYYPAVTTILQDVKVGYGFDGWGKEQAAMLGVEGARLDMVLRQEDGTIVHQAIERALRGETLFWSDFPGKRNDDMPWKCLNRFAQWHEATQPEVLATEMTVYSHTYGFAGTCDAIMSIGGDIYVVDFKTSKQVNPSHELQVAAYATAVDEMFPTLRTHSADGRIHAAVLALNTRHKAGYHFSVVDSVADAWVKFYHRLICFRDEHPKLDPKHDLLPETLSIKVRINPTLVGGAA